MKVIKERNGLKSDRYSGLVSLGLIDKERLQQAENTAAARGIDIEDVLTREMHIPKKAVLIALSNYFELPSIEYDERIPVPKELLEGIENEALQYGSWFPVIKDGDTVVIAANDPADKAVEAGFRKYFGNYRRETRVALKEDINWFIRDFLHARPGKLIGTERTGLANWRNTMAQWRTRLACYRTDLASARTGLASLRAGLGLVAITDALMRTASSGTLFLFYWILFAWGLGIASFGLMSYLKIRGTKSQPPGHQTIVEVTAATLCFLEDYHFIENTPMAGGTKKTMLGRLGDFIAGHSTILYPSPASKERTHLARERNVLAAQRTVAAAYRTIYARARTGLAFIRTGVAFTSIGLAFIGYYGLGLMSMVDSLLMVTGVLMAIDGLQWYLPVRKEQAELPRCVVG